MKTKSLEKLTDKHIGSSGTPKRERFEFELHLDILGYMIKREGKEKNLTQAQLEKLI